jgi:hypothetical protein
VLILGDLGSTDEEPEQKEEKKKEEKKVMQDPNLMRHKGMPNEFFITNKGPMQKEQMVFIYQYYPFSQKAEVAKKLFKELHKLALKTELIMADLGEEEVIITTEVLNAQGKSAYFFNTSAGISEE